MVLHRMLDRFEVGLHQYPHRQTAVAFSLEKAVAFVTLYYVRHGSPKKGLQ